MTTRLGGTTRALVAVLTVLDVLGEVLLAVAASTLAVAARLCDELGLEFLEGDLCREVGDTVPPTQVSPWPRGAIS